MTTNDHVFGSGDLTPEMVRSVHFNEREGKVDAADVRAYLESIASSLEVFLSADLPSAIRAEFGRGANIADGVLAAAQTASDQMRRQAAEESKRILDEARDATLGLRETVEGEITEARVQVETMRSAFIQDLRDLYDRIGASLYRFERAAEEQYVAPIHEPVRSTPHEVLPAASTEPSVIPSVTTDRDEMKPPAWQQLPPEAWQPVSEQPVLEEKPVEPSSDTEPDGASHDWLTVEDPFAVVEDEPLAPGEPLVDLRESTETSEAVQPADIAHDDALAEALIAGEAPSPIPAPVLEEDVEAANQSVDQVDINAAGPISEPVDVGPMAVSQDSHELRNTILELSAAGHSRESIAVFLRDQFALAVPEPLINATLGMPSDS